MALVGDSFEYYDRRFYDLTVPTAEVEELYDGCRWAEGPVWFNEHSCLVWSDIPNRRLLRWIDGQGVSVFRSDSNYANGNTRDRQGRLVSCEHGGRQVTRTEPDGTITVIADAHAGKPLNSPTTSSSSPTAASGSAIPTTASCPTMRAIAAPCSRTAASFISPTPRRAACARLPPIS